MTINPSGSRPVLTNAPAQQKGVALIMVLFVFALVSILAAGMISRQQLFIERSGNILVQAQAYETALGAESFARQILYRDWEEDKNDKEFVDHEKETWAEYSAAFPIEYGVIEIQADDLQGRFNLNDLISVNGQFDSLSGERLTNLLTILEIENVTVDKIKDWIDEDDESTGANGGEDGTYLVADPPYRVGNQPFKDVSELRLIDGMTAADFQKLEPFVAALPRGTTGININTAPPQILRALAKKTISESAAEAIIEQRREEPFTKVADFAAREEYAGQELSTKGLTVQTEFFLVSTRVTLGERVSRLSSLIHRDNEGKLQVLQRNQSRKYLITKQAVIAAQ